MNEDLNDIRPSHIRKYNYAQWFEEVQYNGKTLSDEERKEFITVIDEAIADFSEGLPLMYGILESYKGYNEEFNGINRTVVSVMFFVLITMIDSMVASKYFILADKDYDRRFMRGKLMVILNEGYKRLYGFDEKTYNKSEWDRLLPLLGYFPEEINHQYQELTFHLEKYAQSSSWWRNERNYETHLESEKLFVSRQEEIIESKVMMDTMKIFNTLIAVDRFLTNVYACIKNFLLEKYRLGELRVE